MGLGSHSLAASPWGRWTSDCQLLGDTAGKGGHGLGYLPHCCPNSKNSVGERALYTGRHWLCLLESQCVFLMKHSLHSCTPTVQTGHQSPLPALSHQLLSVSPPNGILLEDWCLAEFWVPGGCKKRKKGRCSLVKRKAIVGSLWSCWLFLYLLDFQAVITPICFSMTCQMKTGWQYCIISFSFCQTAKTVSAP